jgi:hypothetical protein
MSKVTQIFAVVLAGLTVVATAGATPVLAQPAAEAEREWPKSFTCTFDAGTRGSYEGGKFTSAETSPLSFEVTDIDLEGQGARLRTGDKSEASGTLRIVRAINANHFLEVVPEGFLNLTTIYDDENGNGEHPAVHSRHLGVLGQPMFSQYRGMCRADK